ncbi:MAG: D-2-hydroxyacid dehydrogenase [Actinobacteria bacterium]|nr:MAG: D-2-hydroxyacid dehydrogenase [Actinomycetota bacterium]
MTERPVVVVWRAASADRLPGIGAAGGVAEVRFAPDASSLRPALEGADAMFFFHGSKPDLEEAWPSASRLRWIQSASDGVDGLLFPALVQSEIEVTNARGVFDDAIAEWVIGAMLAMVTGLGRSILSQTERRWDDDRGTERLAGKRFLAVGPGPIGRAAARRARDLGMSVAAVGRAPRPDDLFERIGGRDDLHPMLGEADVVLDALPLSPGTHHFFDAAAFAAMKPTARFLNVGRGATVDEAALVDALERGAIGGAALDVYEEEPLPVASPLWSLPTVIVSPHICGDFAGWERAVVDVFLDNLGRFVRGEPLRNQVDTRAGFGIG